MIKIWFLSLKNLQESHIRIRDHNTPKWSRIDGDVWDELNLFLLIVFGRNLRGPSWRFTWASLLEMKNKMMEFSFEKVGVDYRIKRGRNHEYLTLILWFLEHGLVPLDAVSFSLHFGMVFVWFLLLDDMWKDAGNLEDSKR